MNLSFGILNKRIYFSNVLSSWYFSLVNVFKIKIFFNHFLKIKNGLYNIDFRHGLDLFFFIWYVLCVDSKSIKELRVSMI